MDVFRRKELKFVITPEQRQALLPLLEEKMLPDPYGPGTIRNIYFDTADDRLIRKSLEKPAYKEKLRLRCYDDGHRTVFLEMKKKYKGIVYKRRMQMTQAQAMDFMAFRGPLPQDSQIGRELCYFRDFYKDLTPKVYLSYDRQGWFSKTDPGLRITMDCNIFFRRESLQLTQPPGGQPVLAPEFTLLEVKAENAVPLWLSNALTENMIRQVSFSKYGRAYLLGLQADINEKRGIDYAKPVLLYL